jgi:hypothetical protein
LEEVIIKEKPIKSVTINQVDQADFKNTAIIQSLNKITAKTKELKIKVGKKTKFGKLDITIHKCWAAPLYEEPENKMLLEVIQRKGKEEEKKERIFYGWMLSSSPSISSLEHPIYDITALECFNNK